MHYHPSIQQNIIQTKTNIRDKKRTLYLIQGSIGEEKTFDKIQKFHYDKTPRESGTGGNLCQPNKDYES